MEAATVPTAPPEAAPVAEAEQSPEQKFKWYAWVHVGPGAEECPHATDGKCELESEATSPEDRHFHAWCRLPNQFQIRDIAEKARAAKARKMRALRDPQTDQYAILENELDALDLDAAVQELIDRDWLDDYNAAMAEVGTREEYEHIAQDQEEYQRQAALEPEARDEGFDHLAQHVAKYAQDIDAELSAATKPKRENLTGLGLEAVVSRVRRARIEALGNEEYLHTYNYWQWFIGTMKPKDGGPSPERRFREIAAFKQYAEPEVIDALRDTFSELESELAKGRAAKNS